MVRSIFEISVNVVEMFIVIRFLSLYLGFKYTGVKRYVGFGLAWCVTTVVLSVINYFFQYEGIIGLSLMLLYFLYSYVFLKGSTTMKLFVSGFINCIVYLISFCMGLIINILSRSNLNDMFVELGAGRISWIVVTKIILLAVSEIMIRHKADPDMELSNAWVFILVPVAAMFAISILMYTSLENEALQLPMLAASVSIIVICILTYYSYIRISEDSRVRADYKLLQERYEIDKRNAENIKELYDSACSIRHDIKLHLGMIRSLMADSVDSAEQYIDSVLKSQVETALSFINSGNKAFDAVVNTKLCICKKLNIYAEMRIMKNALNGLSDVEIGVLFGNLLDNAIEAASRADEKSITLEVQKQGEYISVFISNSIQKSVLKDNKLLKTTKAHSSMHGYGTKNIRKIVEKREGIIDFFEENGRFCCDILL